MISGGSFAALASMDQEEDPLQREPVISANPPQMYRQTDPYPYEKEDEMPYFVRMKEVQETITVAYPGFPMQANKDFLVSTMFWEGECACSSSLL